MVTKHKLISLSSPDTVKTVVTETDNFDMYEQLLEIM
jgi:hypothetical protein